MPTVSVSVHDADAAPTSMAWGAAPETLFQAASISKPVTALATLRLAADGAFDLDDEVNELLHNWKLPDGDGVTIGRILSHSAGLSVHGFDGYQTDADIPSVVQILDGEPPANNEPVRVARPPGEAYQYSGGGYTLLQLALEDVTGEPFASLMRRVVLDPLAMRSSTYEQPLPPALRSVGATGHDLDGKPLPGRWRVHPEQAAAGLWTNPSELVRVAAEMIRPGSVLTDSIRDAMLTPYSAPYFGLGWWLEPPWFQHGGSNAGFRCLVFGSVRHGQAAAVMTNGDGGFTLCSEIMAGVAEVVGWPDFLRERDAITLGHAALDAVVGDYELEPDAVLSIRPTHDGLISSGPGFAERELFASSPTTFFRTDLDAEIHLTEDGLSIDFDGISVTAKRRTQRP